jgi:hypothetical protein
MRRAFSAWTSWAFMFLERCPGPMMNCAEGAPQPSLGHRPRILRTKSASAESAIQRAVAQVKCDNSPDS